MGRNAEAKATEEGSEEGGLELEGDVLLLGEEETMRKGGIFVGGRGRGYELGEERGRGGRRGGTVTRLLLPQAENIKNTLDTQGNL